MMNSENNNSGFVAALGRTLAHESQAVQALAAAFFARALPDDLLGLEPENAAAMVRRAMAVMHNRMPGVAKVHVESIADGSTRRRMAFVIVNDDMPFLVDSVTQLLTTRAIQISQLFHPVLGVTRDASGLLAGVDAESRHRESLIYIETDRLPARDRAELARQIQRVLASVRLAVNDWQPMRAAVRSLIASGEDEAFLNWIANDQMTLLGVCDLAADGAQSNALGLFRDPAFTLWDADAPQRPDRLAITKADRLSPVHRRVLLDVVRVPQGDDSLRLIAGLFTSASYAERTEDIPIVRTRVRAVRDASGLDPKGHAGKALAHVLEHFPRDELFQIDAPTLERFALRMVSLGERPRPALFLRRVEGSRFASVLVYLPRDAYRADVRVKVGQWLERSLAGDLARYSVEFLDDALARVHYVIAGPDSEVTADALEAGLVAMVRGWNDDLQGELASQFGGVRSARLALTYGSSFSAAYREQFSARAAALDIARLAELKDTSSRDVYFYRDDRDAPHRIRLKVYRLGDIIPLHEMVPVLEHFGLQAVEEYAYDLEGGRLGWIHDFVLDAEDRQPLDLEALRPRLEPALTAVLTGAKEDDAFNALILRLGIDAAQVEIFRALFRYLRQTGSAYGLDTVKGALLRYPELARALAALFAFRFDPARHDAAKEAEANAAIAEGLKSVAALDEDRILRQYQSVIAAIMRTNAYAATRANALAFKIRSRLVPGLPLPVPFMEIWVYSPRVEGIHLRGGKVARGGLRWSDRRDDFRTEVLSLMKAQTVKNAVIVPVGAKGGFYPKQLPPAADRDAWLKEGTESYKCFIRALLSLTDNLVDGKIVPPADVVRQDEDDPYLVVAADKGTATFSDIANGIAIEHDFWLGDAFASGGSVGYDHKKMGITAKGAWISVERHFREMNINVATDSIRAIGVGDMSGDVFGNGLLRTRAIKLVAAFDHRDIFIDPEPDPAKSFDERQRLFDLPRSSWQDYDKGLISSGGGVFSRAAKSISLTPQMKAMLETSADALTPAELIQAILRSPADLLWLGGIGTYVKAASESHAQAGDKANDSTRVDAEELRVKVIGEGANLGVTQKGRIAFAQRGGRMNTDFIDNSAGVDCSDNEVNIKILLRIATASGALAMADRDVLLAQMTDDVSAIVLRDNYQQTQALSIAEAHGAEKLASHARLIKALEAQGGLNRAVEGLPGERELDERQRQGKGLTRPELAVLLAYAKMTLFDALLHSEVVDDPLLIPDLEMAFPPQLRERYAPQMQQHRLRRELIATKLANALVNRGGLTLAFDLAEETGMHLDHVAAMFVAARDIFNLRALWRLIDSYDYKVAAKVQTAALIDASRMLRLHMADLLRYCGEQMSPSAVVAKLKPGIDRTTADVFSLLRPEPRAQVEAYRAHCVADGIPEDVTARLLQLKALDGAIGVSNLAADIKVPDAQLAEAYTILGEQLGLDWANGACEQLAPADPWERLLLSGTSHECERLRLDLIRRLVPEGDDPVARIQQWLAGNDSKIARARALMAEMRSQPPMTTAKLTHLTTQVRQLIGG